MRFRGRIWIKIFYVKLAVWVLWAVEVNPAAYSLGGVDTASLAPGILTTALLYTVVGGQRLLAVTCPPLGGKPA